MEDQGSNTFDISAYEVEDTATLDVQNIKRTGDLLGQGGLPVRIKIYSPGSKQGVKATHKADLAATLRIRATFGGKIDKDAAAQAEEERAQKLASVTAEIENFPIPGGALALYSNPKLADITNQVAEFYANLSNFSKGTPKP